MSLTLVAIVLAGALITDLLVLSINDRGPARWLVRKLTQPRT